MKHSWNRLLAWLIDWLCILAWVAIVAAIGIPLYLSGVTADLPLVQLNLIASATLVVPVTFALASLEASTMEGSLGKRARHLRVVSARTGSRMSFPQSLARTALKVALPWTIGHAAVYGLVTTSPSEPVPIWLWVTTGIAYLIPIVYVVSLFVGTGRTPYDRLCGTVVAARR